MGKEIDKKVVLISLDALSDTEFERLKKLDNFSKFIKKGAYSYNSISVYPTQTYTVHTSVITGDYPDKHGIYNNQYFQPFVESKDKEWFWYRHQIKTNTLYDVLRENKRKVCSVLWPVSGKSRIKYNMPEIVAVKKENQALKVLKNGSLVFSTRCELKYGKYRKGILQPELDEFAVMCAVDCIKRHAPDLVMVHLVSIDAAKHNYGVESDVINDALIALDKMIGDIIDACNDEYTFVMFSDHGQFTVEKDVFINVFLEKNGLLSFENKTYDSYIECMGGSGVLRAKNSESFSKTLKLLEDNKDMLGIEEIYNREDLDELHINTDIEIIIEAKNGYHLKEGNSEKVIADLKEENIVHATHGYSPLKDNYSCLFFAMGDGIKQGYKIDEMEVVDIAPTVARVMGINEFKCDGHILEHILE